MTYAERKTINDRVFEENKRRILSDPSLIIDKLSIDKAVFSRDDIESEIYKVLIGDLSEIHGKNNNDNQKNYEDTDYLRSNSDLKAKIEQELLMMYSAVISSGKVRLINPSDLRGRMLFARSDRMELEGRLETGIREPADNNSRRLVVNSHEIRPIRIGGMSGKTQELSEEQKTAVREVLEGSNISVPEGYPGSGKSTVIKEVVGYKEEQYRGQLRYLKTKRS